MLRATMLKNSKRALRKKTTAVSIDYRQVKSGFLRLLLMSSAIHAIYRANAMITIYESEISEALMGFVIYSDSTTAYEVIDKSRFVCDIDQDIVFLNNPDGGCHSVESFAFKYGAVNTVSKGSYNYVGASVTVIDHDVIKSYPDGHRSGLYFAIAMGNPVTSSLVEHRGSALAVHNGTFRLYRVDPGSDIESVDGKLVHSGTGEKYSRVTPTITSYYYLAKGVGEQWLEVGVDLPNISSRYIPRQDVTVPRIPVGVSHETNINLRLPFLETTQRVKRFPSLALSIAALATTAIHEKSVQAGFAVQDRNAANLKAHIEEQITLQTESLEREGAILHMDLIIMEETAVNKFRHAGLITMVQSIRSKNKGINQYLLQLTHLQDGTTSAHVKIREAYRSELLKKGHKVLFDYIQGTKYVATLSSGELASGRHKLKCDQLNCFAFGTWEHYASRGKVQTIDSPVLTTLTCGVFFKNTTQYERGVISGFYNVQEVLTYIQPKSHIEYFFVLNASCASGVETLNNPLLETLNNEAKRILKVEVIQNVREGFKLECPPIGPNDTLGNNSLMLRSHLCETKYKLDDINATIKDLKALDIVVHSSLDAFTATQKRGMENLLGVMVGETMENLAEIGKNFGKIKRLWENEDELDTMDVKIKVCIALSVMALAWSALNTCLFLCLYSRLRKRMLERHSPASDGI